MQGVRDNIREKTETKGKGMITQPWHETSRDWAHRIIREVSGINDVRASHELFDVEVTRWSQDNGESKKAKKVGASDRQAPQQLEIDLKTSPTPVAPQMSLSRFCFANLNTPLDCRLCKTINFFWETRLIGRFTADVKRNLVLHQFLRMIVRSPILLFSFRLRIYSKDWKNQCEISEDRELRPINLQAHCVCIISCIFSIYMYLKSVRRFVAAATNFYD